MSCHKKFLKRCEFCGRYFRAHRFVGSRQRACTEVGCKKKRKQSSQKSWLGKNPEYFRGRYGELKRWRDKHPGYQRQWRAKRREIQDLGVTNNPIKSIRLVIPGKLLRGEIKDVALTVRRHGSGFWVAGTDREMQDKMAGVASH